MAPLYSTLQPNKKWNDYVILAKRRIERLYSQILEWSHSILFDSPTKRTLSDEQLLKYRRYIECVCTHVCGVIMYTL
jgi:hypothetical protein